MSSLFAPSPDPQQMPGFHYARIMAATLLLEPDHAKRVQESARLLLARGDR